MSKRKETRMYGNMFLQEIFENIQDNLNDSFDKHVEFNGCRIIISKVSELVTLEMYSPEKESLGFICKCGLISGR